MGITGRHIRLVFLDVCGGISGRYFLQIFMGIFFWKVYVGEYFWEVIRVVFL